MRPTPFIGLWQTHCEIVALRGEHSVCGVPTKYQWQGCDDDHNLHQKHLSDTKEIYII